MFVLLFVLTSGVLSLERLPLVAGMEDCSGLISFSIHPNNVLHLLDISPAFLLWKNQVEITEIVVLLLEYDHTHRAGQCQTCIIVPTKPVFFFTEYTFIG